MQCTNCGTRGVKYALRVQQTKYDITYSCLACHTTYSVTRPVVEKKTKSAAPLPLFDSPEGAKDAAVETRKKT